MNPLPNDLADWLRTFSAAVRDRDFSAGGRLFDDGVVSFGTVCFRANNLNELAARQWQVVWPHTEEFEFEYPSAIGFLSNGQATLVAGWQSKGIANGRPAFQRRGRATIVLRQTSAGWKAVHTHFSLEPVTE